MKLGLSSFTYGWAVGASGFMPERPMRLWDLLQLTKEFDLSLLQIGDNVNLMHYPEKEIEEAISFGRENNIEFELGLRGLFDEYLEKYVHLCKQFDAKLLRVVIDKDGYEPDNEEIVRLLKKWSKICEDSGITIAVENHDRFKAKELGHLIKEVNSPNLGICLDTANSFGALEGLETILDEFLPITVNFHAKDVNIKRIPSKQGFLIEGTVCCEGMLNIEDILKRIYSANPEVNCILEQWTQFTESIEKTIEKEAREACIGVDNLKRIIKSIT